MLNTEIRKSAVEASDIRPRSAVNRVITGATLQAIVACAAKKRVVSVIAVNSVIPTCGADRVVAATAMQFIVVCSKDNILRTVIGKDNLGSLATR